jgi:hypothetical protein
MRQNTIALLALFVALSGTAFAAANVVLPKNSVGTKQLKKNAVTTPKIKNGAVTGAKIKLSSLGKVPSAANADHSTAADSATNATNATNAANANTLGGLLPSAFLGAANARADGFASSADIDNFTSSTYTNIAAKTFTAPVAGFIFVVGTVSTEDDLSFAGRGDLFYRLARDGTGLTNDLFYHEIASDSGTNITGTSGAASAVVPVTAGSHTVSLQAREAGTGDFILGRDISVIFVPNGSASTIPFAPSGSGPSPQSR